MLLVLLLKWRLPWRSLPPPLKSSRRSIMIVHSGSSSIRWLKHLVISMSSLLRRRRGRTSTPSRVSISSWIVIVIHMSRRSRWSRRPRWSKSAIDIVSESSSTTSASSPRTEISSSPWWSSTSSSIVPYVIRRSSRRSLHISSGRRPTRSTSRLSIAWPIVIAIVIIPDWWRPRWGFRIRSIRGFVFLHLCRRRSWSPLSISHG